jgi:hypothetical protein
MISLVHTTAETSTYLLFFAVIVVSDLFVFLLEISVGVVVAFTVEGRLQSWGLYLAQT